MSKGDLPTEKRPRRDLFENETLRKIRLTPEADRLEVNSAAGWAKDQSEAGDADWLAEVLPGEKQPRRGVFDDETLRRLRLTAEKTGCKPETVMAPADDSPPWYWPPVSDIALARSAAIQGVGAALVIAVCSLIFAGMVAADVGLFSELGFDSSQAWDLVFGAAVYFAIAWGIHRSSRIAAVLGLVLYLLDRAVMLGQLSPKFGIGLVVALPVLVAFVNGVRGTFAYHRLALVDYCAETVDA